jgi:hypothetical protein
MVQWQWLAHLLGSSARNSTPRHKQAPVAMLMGAGYGNFEYVDTTTFRLHHRWKVATSLHQRIAGADASSR